MIPIYNSSQIKKADAYTIKHEPISSIKLMERAAKECADWFEKLIFSENNLHIICGKGNNGGDGLAIARLLHKKYKVYVYIIESDQIASTDFLKNLKKLQSLPVHIEYITDATFKFTTIDDDSVIVDAIFGTGLNKPVQGIFSKTIRQLNKFSQLKISIDIPSGLRCEACEVKKNPDIFIADHTLTFEFPKLSFFFQENQEYVGEFTILKIGIPSEFYLKEPSAYTYMTDEYLSVFLEKRPKFSHKGNFGHTLIVAGSRGMYGAAVLAAKACLRGGTGKLTVHVPSDAEQIMQISVPEAMLSLDEHEHFCTNIQDITKYNVIALGPGLGKDKATQKLVRSIIESAEVPLIIDADALNILAENRDWLALLPENTIITPHPGEFERLFGKTKSTYERLELQREASANLKIFIICKGAYTCISTPGGTAFFNPTGNPGMATAGSGDVLLGLLAGLRFQVESTLFAAFLGVYLHGLAGDLASYRNGQISTTASDICDYISDAFQNLLKEDPFTY